VKEYPDRTTTVKSLPDGIGMSSLAEKEADAFVVSVCFSNHIIKKEYE